MSVMRIFVLTSVMCLGCEAPADVIAKHRSAVSKTFGAIQALGPKANVEAAKLKTPPVPLILDGAGSNAMVIYAEDLVKPGGALPVHLRTLDSLPLLQCGSLLEKAQYFNDTITRLKPSVVEGYLGDCERLRYVLVIRETEFKQPVVTIITKSFTPGVLRADVLVFDLTDGAYLGSFAIDAKNEESIQLLDGDTDHRPRLLSNLESVVFSALRDGARTAFPGSVPPPPKR
jgi:hypothetical protein